MFELAVDCLRPRSELGSSMGNADQAIEIRIARKQQIAFRICLVTCVVALVALVWVAVNDLDQTIALIGIPINVLLIVQAICWLKWRLFIDRNGITTKLF